MMKKLKAFLCGIIFFSSSFVLASDHVADTVMWENAHRGHFSIVQKLAVTRPADNMSDEIMNQMIMAYAYYRIGKFDQVEPIFKGVDRYIEYMLEQRDE